MKTSGNTILMTGGGSGIGRELAREFQARGNMVIVAGRRAEALEETIGGRAAMQARTLDVSDAADIASFAAKLLADFPSLNVVFNNAGIMAREDWKADPVDLAVAEATVATNILGPIRLTAAFLPHLCKQAAARVVNVTSGLAFVPLAHTPAYSASKAAMHAWSQSLRWQLRDTSVDVIELAPPGVQTDLTPGQSARETYMPLADFIAETMESFGREDTPDEVIVQRAKMLRAAEAAGNFDQIFEMLNARYEG
ncbi:MAG: SDR family oxidoreductase [Hyphomonas sp.]|uniref:SDR family oxidoreductase n=1 Tax=Hyphomonas sp. TaxID=87 RepID=UPI0035275742